MSGERPGVVVAHPGRQHNLEVALGLQNAGMLQKFIGGLYFKPKAFPYTLLSLLPVGVRDRATRKLKERYVEGLDSSRVVSIPYFELTCRTIGRTPALMSLTGGRSVYEPANWASDRWVSRWLGRERPAPALFYGFLGASLLSIRAARRLGIISVLDVPITLDATEVLAKERASLGLKGRLQGLDRRLRQEVLEADYVVVPAPAVADSVVKLGVSPNRLLIVPFGVDVTRFRPRQDGPHRREFTALFVGQFDLRKGVHYLLDAWSRLALPNGRLAIVGPPGEPQFVKAMRARYGGQFDAYGPVPRSAVSDLFAAADVFVFPSLAEGSALVTYEALASGLPCIVTLEAGSVVRDGVEGFIVPSRDSQSIANQLGLLHRDEILRMTMAAAARRRAETYTWSGYHQRLADAIVTLLR